MHVYMLLNMYHYSLIGMHTYVDVNKFIISLLQCTYSPLYSFALATYSKEFVTSFVIGNDNIPR